ncbi:hypothetical protein ACRQ1B_23460 [Rhizobium panacihumi]|uniref:hypothetical protein n=1 Tax=Rhizobium panacihumi TaxID=2008450 RepID=UPI003D78BFC4
MRPSTLREVSERVVAGADPVKQFSEFLDHFYDRPDQRQMQACLLEEPMMLDDVRLNAFYAASADYLSKRYRLGSIPAWSNGQDRCLDSPWFTQEDQAVRGYLSFSSPAEFRCRNIFTEAVPLRRARTWQAEERLQQRLAAA